MSCPPGIPPGVIAETLLEHIESPELSTETVCLKLNSVFLKTGHEANLPKVVALFLQGFHLPEELIRVAGLYSKEVNVNANYAFLRDLRFTGTVQYMDGRQTNNGRYTVLEISATAAEARLIQWPLDLLVTSVANLARYWSELSRSQDDQSVHHALATEWELQVFLDLQVAAYYGFTGIADLRYKTGGLAYALDADRRKFSVQGALPVSRKTLDSLIVARQVTQTFISKP